LIDKYKATGCNNLGEPFLQFLKEKNLNLSQVPVNFPRPALNPINNLMQFSLPNQ
jgi:hypothetical protein